MQVERAAEFFGNRWASGERVSNTWVTCPEVGDNPGKPELIPHDTPGVVPWRQSRKALEEGHASYQVVGEVMAHQADDG